MGASLSYFFFYFIYTIVIFSHANQADITLQGCSFILSRDILHK